jgi:putative peptidoglycan lipid II flippase
MTTEKEAPDAAPAGAGIHPSRVSGQRLIAKTSVVSGMTLLSRILGLVRDVVFARFFGASLVMDAFFHRGSCR